ncbi:MAG TPA: citrate synthase [Planctomycetes bacterium]|nr:citrate synthase [Planctomycetota bacterium]HIN81064.1 citrate synthase [Planctomycetota bacterium]
MSKKAVLRIGDQEVELPVVIGSEDEPAVDIRSLRKETGYVTLDPGYVNTGSTRSAITFIDGENGILRYRGYPIEELAERSNFVETSYLLIHGELPTPEEYEQFRQRLRVHSMIHEDMKHFYDGFPSSSHPMAIISAMTLGLSTFYPEAIDPTLDEETDLTVCRLLSKVRTIAAFSFKKSVGQPFVYPDNSLTYCGNFLHMMFKVPAESYHVDPEVERALNLLLILHADHEQNCSTSTVRMVGSAQSNLFACIAAGICALWGTLHGGANQAVLQQLSAIQKNDNDVKKFVELAKEKESGVRLMGFGHRVYRNFDPRATIIKEACHRLLNHLGIEDNLLDIALELEEVAVSDPYFIDRKLYPNVDFYSGIMYRAIGIPTNMFTVMFALGRLPGWIAHWLEMQEDPDNRIHRPRQIYTGELSRPYPQ